MKKLHIDFETRSAIDLRKTGAEVYAQDLSTQVLCMAFAFDDEPVELWRKDGPVPTKVLSYVESGGRVVAHNYAFEYNVWNNHCVFQLGWPPLTLEQGECTMSMAYAMSLPGSLDSASRALGLDYEKDMKAQRIMLQLAKPRRIDENTGEPIFYEYEDSPEKFETTYKYCMNDVEVERALDKRLMQLSKSERALWLLDQKINSRGVRVDIEAVMAVQKIVDSEKIRLNKAMKEATDFKVSTCTASGQLIDYLNWNGIHTDTVAKPKVLELLEDDKTPEPIKKILSLRKEASQTSVAKLVSMKNGACLDGRTRGLFQYHGAATGRWAGRRVQLQNLKRPSLSQGDIDEIFKCIKVQKEIPEKFGKKLDVIADCIRGFLVPKEGYDFIGCDFSAIEARVLAWLAGEEGVLNVFRGHGKIYEAAAAGIYRCPINEVTKEQRQIGKVAVLALGYGGGKGAFMKMASGYGVDINEDDAETIKTAWREANPSINRYWYALEDAAMSAVANPGVQKKAGPREREINYLVNGSFLWCRLPSGRVLCYPYPKIEMVMTPWGDPKQSVTYMSLNVGNKWVRTKTYGGKLCENVTQAVARDLLAESLFRLEEKGYPVVIHVHDEAVVEVPKAYGSVREVETIMSRPPSWAKALPIKAEGWRGIRYQK